MHEAKLARKSGFDFRFAFLAWAGIWFLLWFRPEPALKAYTALDDQCYLGWLARLLGQSYPACFSDSYMPGIALLWLPAGALSWILSKLTSWEFSAWIAPLVGVYTYVLWLACAAVFVKIVRRHFSEGSKATLWTACALFLATPVLYYGTHRTTLAHVGEFLIGLLVLDRVLAPARMRNLVAALVLALFMVIIRLNDAPVLLVVVAAAVSAGLRKAFIGVCGLAFVASAVYIAWLGQFRSYNYVRFEHKLRNLDWTNLSTVLWGGDWGLLWTAPFWLACLAFGFLLFPRLSLTLRAASIWVICELILVVSWGGNGSDFAYRYLIGSYVGALLLAHAALKTRWSRALGWIAGMNAFWILALTWFYKAFPGTLTQRTSRFWTNPDLQLNTLSLLFNPSAYGVPLQHSPIAVLERGLASGPVYFVLIVSTGLAVVAAGVGLLGFISSRYLRRV